MAKKSRARHASTYRCARRNRARRLLLDWRQLPHVRTREGSIVVTVPTTSAARVDG